jgi:hypothetical protein
VQGARAEGGILLFGLIKGSLGPSPHELLCGRLVLESPVFFPEFLDGAFILIDHLGGLLLHIVHEELDILFVLLEGGLNVGVPSDVFDTLKDLGDALESFHIKIMIQAFKLDNLLQRILTYWWCCCSRCCRV